MSDTLTSSWTVENIVRGAANIDKWRTDTNFLVRKVLATVGESDGMKRLLPQKGSFNLIDRDSEQRCSWEMMRRPDGKVHVRCVWDRLDSEPMLAYSSDPTWTDMETMGLGGVQFAYDGLPIFLHGMLNHTYFPNLRDELRHYNVAGMA